MRARLAATLITLFVLLAAAGCGGATDAVQDAPDTLHVLAGSELSDLQPLFPEILAKTGITLKLDYAGTLVGAEDISSGNVGNHSVAWFSSTDYLSLLPGGRSKLAVSNRIMLSPVIMGVKHTVAQRLGWTNGNVTWKDIATAAENGSFRFAMTNPTSSNTGFSALVGVASALSGSTSALTSSNINGTQLAGFFKGLQLTAGSSGFLASSYQRDPTKVDELIHTKSVLMGLNATGNLADKLDLIYPSDGVITADYPIVLLDPSKRALYDKLVTYLTSPAFQQELMTKTSRRPVSGSVHLDSRFPSQVLNELSFPGSLSVIQTLLDQYLNVYTKPSHTYYVLDLSGSMQGDRLNQLQQAFQFLTDTNSSGSQGFARFRSREEVTIVTFNDSVLDTQSFTIGDATKASDLKQIRDYVDSQTAGGGTAIYDAMHQAYQLADEARTNEPDHFVSVVLMTDGENNSGEGASDFLAQLSQLKHHDIPAFPIRFGEGNAKDLQQIASSTGGKLFDSTQASLASTFEEIRGYQ